jgi:hypothetical protein
MAIAIGLPGLPRAVGAFREISIARSPLLADPVGGAPGWWRLPETRLNLPVDSGTGVVAALSRREQGERDLSVKEAARPRLLRCLRACRTSIGHRGLQGPTLVKCI